jgi:hypothetical protein
MFIENEFTEQYYRIIKNAKIRLPNGSSRKQAKILLSYTELHHIIPKSIGGETNQENLVWLTAEEHLAVHLLLPKMVYDEKNVRKMVQAVIRMINPQSRTQKRVVTNEVISEIAHLRKEAARLHSNFMKGKNKGENNPFFGKHHSDKAKQLQRKANLNRLITDSMRKNYSNGRKKYYADNPNQRPHGEKNPRYIDIVFKWENMLTGETLYATRLDMTSKYPELKSNISQVINGKYKHVKGWKIIA